MNLIKLEMIDSFYLEVKQIFKEYFEGNFNNFEFQRQINRYYDSWFKCRLDIRNTGGKSNSIKCINDENFLDISSPKWLDDGRGCVVRSANKTLNLTFKCNEKGDITLYLRGEDFRNIYHKRVPVFINYKKLVFNGNLLFNDIHSVWHDKSYIHHDHCENNEKITVEIEFETIYDIFPKLIEFRNEFIKENNINTVIKLFNQFEEYINKVRLDLTKSVDDENYWKKEYVNLTKDVTDLKINLTNYMKNTNNILDSYNILFDSIFKYHKIEPVPVVKYSREFNNELLDFIDNVCKKHGLKWWMNFGILIGAIRHGGNVPWDDDYDISMMREDYEKFYGIIKNEIKIHNLDKHLYVNFNKTGPNNSLLSFMKYEFFDNGRLFGFIDIIPYDYVNKEIDNAENTFHKQRREFLDKLRKGVDRETAFKEYFKLFDVSKTKTDTIIGGIEANYYMQVNYNTIFPLKNIKFEDKYYPAPNDSKGILEQRYNSEIMKVPKVVFNHTFFDKLSGYDDVYEVFEKHIAHLRKINAEMRAEYEAKN